MKRLLIFVGVLALLVPGALLAQDGLTLESLAEKMAALVERVDGIGERVEAIESMWEGPGAVLLDDERCMIGGRPRRHSLQDETVLNYKVTYDEWPDIGDFRVVEIVWMEDPERTGIVYEDYYKDRYVVEIWEGCEFIGSSDWWIGE